jgi:acetylornithine/N-succinyldiaminopimelate aminotransferase
VNLEQVQKLEARLLLSTYERYPVLLHKGRGVYIYDHKGRKYLDLLSGIGVNALGYAHPALTKTAAQQAKLLVHTSNLFYHEYQARLAAALTKVSGMDRAFFTNSGTEAWEAALKVARAYARANCPEGQQPKWRILALEHAFHGRTFGALATTHKEKYRAPFEPGVPGVEFVKFDDVTDLERKFDATVCAIGFEFIQGEGGIRPVSRAFAEKAHELTKSRAAWDAPAAGSRISITEFSPIWLPWPSRWPEACRWEPCWPARGFPSACIPGCTGLRSAEDRWPARWLCSCCTPSRNRSCSSTYRRLVRTS